MKDTAPPTRTRATGADQPMRPTTPVTETVVITKRTIQLIVPTVSIQSVSGPCAGPGVGASAGEGLVRLGGAVRGGLDGRCHRGCRGGDRGRCGGVLRRR